MQTSPLHRKSKSTKIREYWESQAKLFKGDPLATNPDEYGRELEIRTLVKHIRKYPNLKGILDIGCGNGYTTIEIARRLPYIVVTGIDYSENMVRNAHERLCQECDTVRQRVTFAHFDILHRNNDQFRNKYQMIITARCLINLADFDVQRLTVMNIHSYLKLNGIYLMLENTVQGMNRMNDLRERVRLHRIPMRWHNQYFDENELLPLLEENFHIIDIDNFESTYVIASRVVNAALTPSGKEPNYKTKINLIGSKLFAIGDYGPTKLFVLQKSDV